METFRGKTYSFSPVCIVCREHTEEKTSIPATSGRYNREWLVVPAHAGCLKRRRLIGAAGIFGSILVFALVIPLLAGRLTVGMWGVWITLLSPLAGLPLSVLLIDRWIWAPRERFLQEHGLK